jgi:PEP-CTERM motif
MKRSVSSFNLNQYLRKITATTAMLAVVACLVPDGAEARPRLRFSGRSSNATLIDFDIDLLATDEDDDSDSGRFSGAIRNFTYQLSFFQPLQAQFDFGNLVTSLDGPNGTVKYEITFNSDDVKVISNDFDDPDIDENLFANPEDFKLTLLIPSIDPNLVNSLSGQLPRPIEVSYEPGGGTFTLFDDGSCVDEGDIPDTCSLEAVDVPDSTEDIPEPATALSLLGLGALSTASLLKRKKR